jgi:hypothetical protein
VNKLLKIILAITIVVLINLRELLHSKPRGRIMGIYFSVIAISLLLGILINIDKAPPSPNEIIVNFVKTLGLEE